MEESGEPLVPAAHTNDGFFKAIFSQPEHAAAFFKRHLPPGIAGKIDWQSLAVLPGSFVKSSLQQVHSDLLFSCRLGERETLLYLLFEHQSSPDPAMPLRVLGFPMAGRLLRPRSPGRSAGPHAALRPPCRQQP